MIDFKGIDPRFAVLLLLQQRAAELSKRQWRRFQDVDRATFLHELKMSVVPAARLRTQQTIVDILSAYDDLIENNRRRMALLEEAARQLYREWFVRLRFPGHEHTRITNGVPEGLGARAAR